ncbi:MAG: DUF3109 family protein [Porphyromonadaceae bacterium]|nr:DUF3109 family protein [Porphyromonadaceae bacterium]
MLQIGDTLVALDLVEREFACAPEVCRGACCIEGDSGAPITEEERSLLEKYLPDVWDDLTPAARAVIEAQGVAYVDEEGDLVTSIVEGKNCVFTCYDAEGICRCAVEKAYHERRIPFRKPLSCHLYPVRITRYPSFTAVNYHRWSVCKAAEVLGRKEGIKVYRFLREPLIRCFGESWYDELDRTAQLYLEQKEKKDK